MHIDTQFSIFLINKPGVLGTVTEALSAAGVNLYALSLSDSGEHGVLRIVCDDADRARATLREAHDRWTETDVLVLPIGNEPGAFASLAAKLADAGVNILYAYCTAAENSESTTAIVKAPDVAQALDVLK
jgi:hypothetical protein